MGVGFAGVKGALAQAEGASEGGIWVKAHYIHILSTSQNQFSVTSSTLAV
jgi:hypothetical protein